MEGGDRMTREPMGHDEERLGEYLGGPERLVVSPGPGRFEPAHLPDGEVRHGQVVGTVIRSHEQVAVRSEVAGRFMGHLVDSGERVRDGQPLAWIRLAG